MEQIELIADNGKWYTKEPSNEWQRFFYHKVKVSADKASEFTQVTDEYKADYERRRAEYFKQLNEQEDED